ncbi:MAG: hypothetical protein AAF560_06655 [Acidobacteriota bacterium]
MPTTTFVLLIASILSVQGNQATIDRGISSGLQIGDTGTLFYQLTLEQEQRRIDLGMGVLIDAEAQQAVVQIPEDDKVKAGHLIEIRIPVSPADGEELAREARIELVPLQSNTESESETAEPATAPENEVDSEIRDTISRWAAAWSEQRVDDYLSFYAQNFRPPLGMSRSAWEKLRRERISKPARISVRLNRLKIVSVASKAAVATFVQAYRSDTYRDEVPKLLDLVREDGSWKILEEKEIEE